MPAVVLSHPAYQYIQTSPIVGSWLPSLPVPSTRRNATSPRHRPASALSGQPHPHRQREADADSAAAHAAIQPFHIDRRVLRDIVREYAHAQVGRITFLSSGASTSCGAYLITLVDTRLLIVRVARRFMPRFKTESEIATMQYLRDKTSIPVPDVYHYDSNPNNRLGAEYILMSKATGIPLSQVYCAMSNEELKSLFTNLASIILPLFAQRFSHIGSLYFGPSPYTSTSQSSSASSTVVVSRSSSSSTVTRSVQTPTPTRPYTYYVGPIISWPFFGSNRAPPTYLKSCANREINGVIAESNGRSASHRLHLDPDTIHSSRHHHLLAFPEDADSDESDEWDAQESEDEEEDCVGANMYRDYRRMQRGTFLVAHIKRREGEVRREMRRWVSLMERLGAGDEDGDRAGGTEEFGLDCHDLSLENIFVDEKDHTKITCVIDWESTTTRPLWACAHLPAFVESSPFTAKLFREVALYQMYRILTYKARRPSYSPHIPNSSSPSNAPTLFTAASSWLHFESWGTRLRYAHRCVEWDGWEEGLVESILGPEDTEKDWFVEGCWCEVERGSKCDDEEISGDVESSRKRCGCDDTESKKMVNGNEPKACMTVISSSPPTQPARSTTPPVTPPQATSCHPTVAPPAAAIDPPTRPTTPSAALRIHRRQAGMLILKKEREKEQTLVSAGDICGGRGGELGRRLEEVLRRGLR
ncbi:hypothetical protein F5J12DRAFT_922317 [Pisolithus orientalis]|uniref:uncharacterized protein n=1 Tax=Pisolithus orientalis TaxID=936130 RepID=UPI0022256CA6|nr:uncharacterized protein F5J12DRAFT_922317 [Pisolithus orientalis]KAI5997322.1 hypothetical protein F5J12DRAFT_922317 [Pisolithus orientalis]